jgi:hypothetical protein
MEYVVSNCNKNTLLAQNIYVSLVIQMYIHLFILMICQFLVPFSIHNY